LKSHMVNLYGEATLHCVRWLKLIYCPDDGGSTHLWNFGQLQPDYMALHPRRLQTSNKVNLHHHKSLP
jgi:hypothetical protein